ncbi:MAG: transposase [Gammaproteobacteria bacterium]
MQATGLADASCGTIRRKLFKIGALVTISVRRIKLAMASGCPYRAVFATAHRALAAAAGTGRAKGALPTSLLLAPQPAARPPIPSAG